MSSSVLLLVAHVMVLIGMLMIHPGLAFVTCGVYLAFIVVCVLD